MRDRRLDVLAHQVDAVGEQLERIDGTASVPGIERGMRGLAVELHAHVDDRLARNHVRERLVAGVPGEHHVEIIEDPVTCHVGFAADVFLRGRAVESYGAFELAGLDQLLDGERGAEASRAEKIVSAGMTRGARDQRALLRLRFLRQARKGVVFAHDADDRAAAAVAGDERRRHAGHAALDAETVALSVVRKQFRRAMLAQRDFRERPDLIGERDQLLRVAIHGLHDGLLGGAHRLRFCPHANAEVNPKQTSAVVRFMGCRPGRTCRCAR